MNAVTPGCKSSDEILVKNAQNLLQTVLRGVHAAETACITVNWPPWGSQSWEDSWNQCTSKQTSRSYLQPSPLSGKKLLTVQMQMLLSPRVWSSQSRTRTRPRPQPCVSSGGGIWRSIEPSRAQTQTRTSWVWGKPRSTLCLRPALLHQGSLCRNTSRRTPWCDLVQPNDGQSSEAHWINWRAAIISAARCNRLGNPEKRNWRNTNLREDLKSGISKAEFHIEPVECTDKCSNILETWEEPSLHSFMNSCFKIWIKK